jgi:putative phosphotransacetylase
MTGKAERERVIARALFDEFEKCGLRVIPADIPVGVSVRHVHLSRGDLETLFGPGYRLRELRPISQPGQYAAVEQVTLIGPNGRTLERVRIIGPERAETQVELSRTDALTLGISPLVRMSANLDDTPGIAMAYQGRELRINRGVIIAARHLHLSPLDGIIRGLEDGDIVTVRVKGEKGGTMENVHVVVNSRCALNFHIDTDDANAFGLSTGQTVELESYRLRGKP